MATITVKVWSVSNIDGHQVIKLVTSADLTTVLQQQSLYGINTDYIKNFFPYLYCLSC